METMTNLKINGETVKKMLINDKLVYSSTPDALTIINDEAEPILRNAVKLGEKTYKSADGKKDMTYSVYSTFEEGEWTGLGSAGNVHPWFISPHVMVSAQHYNNLLYTGNVTINGVTYNRLKWYNLQEWCAEHNIPFAQGVRNGDIALCTLDKSTGLDISKCPYVISDKTIQRMFARGDTYGCVLWHSPQTSINKQYATPVWGFNGNVYSPKYDNSLMERPTIYSEIDLGYPYFATSGDSGKVVYFMYKGKPVVVSQLMELSSSSWIGYGPAFPQVVNPLREFVKWHEGADILKELTIDD